MATYQYHVDKALVACEKGLGLDGSIERRAHGVDDHDRAAGRGGAVRDHTGGVCTRADLAAAIHWYSQGQISQGKGAEIAGMDRRSFILALGSAGVDAIQVSARGTQGGGRQ